MFPNAPDVCDGRHNDCNAAVGVGRDVGEDVDGDGFASPTSLSCNPDLEGGPEYTDCDDVNPRTYPGARESCDGIINDCTARPQFDISRLVEDPDSDGYYAGNADCINPFVHIESVSSAFDRYWNSATAYPLATLVRIAPEDRPDPLNVYGRSKLAGEQAAQELLAGYAAVHAAA